ncbi:hypothetical protein SSX86_010108 [Deinandra increscens subsp. villosa]|uniref:Uncharacterized protein n=1 Tax=Deinandra increscens subsp. villosa TaxID=3103831 RepID=A0AAP0DEH9_9ASTR
MSVKPTVALRAILVGGIAAFAKIAGAAKAAGGVKLGAAAVAVTAAASATMSGSKQEAAANHHGVLPTVHFWNDFLIHMKW